MALPTFTQASYESVIQTSLDSTTGSKTVTVSNALSVFDTGDVAVINLGSDNEEWFEVTDVDTVASTITFGLRGLSLVSTASLSEVAANRHPHGPGETIAVVTFPNKIHNQNTDTGTDSTTFEINTGGFGAILDSTGLTADRTITFPDSDGPLASATSGTFTTPTLTSPVFDTGVSGTAIVTTIGTPGSDTLIPSEQAVREAITGSVAGVGDINSETGSITLASGVYVNVTNNPAGTFTHDFDTDQVYLFNQIFA